MTAAEPAYRDYHIDDPIVFRAPSPEVMAELRRLLPPVEPIAEVRPARTKRPRLNAQDRRSA